MKRSDLPALAIAIGPLLAWLILFATMRFWIPDLTMFGIFMVGGVLACLWAIVLGGMVVAGIWRRRSEAKAMSAPE